MNIRLCFGTFINVLACCTKETVKKAQITGTVIQTIDPESKYMDIVVLRKSSTLYSELNHLYKCQCNFSPSYSKIEELAPKTTKKAIVKQFESTVIPLIDEDKYAQIVLTICDIIKKDDTLNRKNSGNNIEKFQKHICKDIEDFLNDNEYILSEFLTDIFCYTVMEIKNTSGREWLNEISNMEKEKAIKIGDKRNYHNFFEEYVSNFRDKRNTIQVWETKGQMKRHLHHNSENVRNNQSSDKIQPTSMLCEFFDGYNVKEFIDINPLDSLPSSRVRDAIGFIGRIKLKHKEKNCLDENEEVYKKIILFIDILEKYIEFLAINSINPMSFTKWNYINFPKYEPADRNSDELKEGIKNYHNQLNQFYADIEAEYKRKLKEYKKEWRSRMESTNNVETGSLSNAIMHHLNSNQNSNI